MSKQVSNVSQKKNIHIRAQWIQRFLDKQELISLKTILKKRENNDNVENMPRKNYDQELSCLDNF